MAQLSRAQEYLAGGESERFLLLEFVRFLQSLHATDVKKNVCYSHDLSPPARDSGRAVETKFFWERHILHDQHEPGQFSANESHRRINSSQTFLAREKQISIESATEFVQSQQNLSSHLRFLIDLFIVGTIHT